MNNVTISENTVDRVSELVLEEQNPNLKLRIFVQGGGCSGFQYGFSFEEENDQDDLIIERKSIKFNSSVKFLIDPYSLQYLQGSTIDFIDDINGQQFSINNPNAQTTCGCGSSFSA